MIISSDHVMENCWEHSLYDISSNRTRNMYLVKAMPEELYSERNNEKIRLPVIGWYLLCNWCRFYSQTIPLNHLKCDFKWGTRAILLHPFSPSLTLVSKVMRYMWYCITDLIVFHCWLTAYDRTRNPISHHRIPIKILNIQIH
jgi:hypothetical protein